MITAIMMSDTKGIKDLARVAKNSSMRAYAGHIQLFKPVLNKMELNLTEYARSYGIYKVVHATMSKSNLPRDIDSKKGATTMGKRKREEEKTADAEAMVEDVEGSKLFTRRLQKSKLKELQNKMRDTTTTFDEQNKIKTQMAYVKKEVFTDERKLSQRKAGFDRASNK